MARYIDADVLIKEVGSLEQLARKRVYDTPTNSPAYARYSAQMQDREHILSIIKAQSTADVVPRSEVEVGVECPVCHGTGGIGTSNWLTKHLTEKQLAEEKAKAIKEATEEIERKAKQEVAREIFEEIHKEIEEALKSNYKVLPQVEQSEELYYRVKGKIDALRGIDDFLAELKKKYIGE